MVDPPHRLVLCGGTRAAGLAAGLGCGDACPRGLRSRRSGLVPVGRRVNLNSPRDITAALRAAEIGPKKRWGQNFLVDGNVRRAIVALVDRRQDDRLWEVGPGLGALTELLLAAGPVTAFEIDWGLIAYLRTAFATDPLTIVAGDAVQTLREAAHTEGAPDVVVGNLPYRSAAPILSALFELSRPPRRIVATVQKEMADRLVAPVGTRQYSAFTVAAAAVYRVHRPFDVRPACFYPVPEVVSSVVVMDQRLDPVCAHHRALFRQVKDSLFAGRRKTVLNNLKGRSDLGVRDADHARSLLETAGITPSDRAERVGVEAFGRLTEALAASRGAPS
ncbi:MAG: ribosomal RNA small subunit methyltransferase A [Spirochaetaceae bacterium]|nr:MAG: ribosomal RNA small subunit methyltransferase A [Spirochaetaceae bacterium]